VVNEKRKARQTEHFPRQSVTTAYKEFISARKAAQPRSKIE